MIISIASGKGGTGKTTVAVNLALSIKDANILDCDVEEPNAHIFIKPEIKSKEKVFIPVPEIDKEKCNACGKCKDVCAYNALAILGDTVLVFPELCHGCGACSYFCPQGAIKEVDKEIGIIEEGSINEIGFVHGRLNIGQAMAPPVIRVVKKHIKNDRVNIIDSPPGTSCPVISSIAGSDFCVLVTEPTPFGLNDLMLAVEVLRKVRIPFGVVVNRSDLGDDKTDKYCIEEKIPILMKIPFNKDIARAYSKGEPFVRCFPEYKDMFLVLLGKIKETIA
ncbi:MAG: ATP-binding protein [Candidatus Omnitrophica bacterium]|nr:ATP-binding protein [Candidatus Omnitrophota bacterium]MDD5081192.1 ATP-binding protein [Candidatus Omnitrophota bacterium]MDD5440630.1 ATP-binding protein [Candidatus Omnitrophota bacterium]